MSRSPEVPLLTDAKVLELGCGTGLVGTLAAKLGAHTIITDFSQGFNHWYW